MPAKGACGATTIACNFAVQCKRLGKKVLLPAGMIERVDRDDEMVFVGLTKEQIKNAPEFDENTYRDESYRNDLGSYYSGRGI